MRQIFRILICGVAVFAMASAVLEGQVKISTKKMKIADFQTKTTKVVLSGDAIFNVALQSEISRRWRVSPYEFVTMEEFEQVKTNSNYYFLAMVDHRIKKEKDESVSMLCLFKGGVDDTKSDNASIDVIDVPICSSQDPSGREYVFLPAFIDIIQTYVLDAMQSDRVGYIGLEGYASKVGKNSGQSIYFSEDDLDSEVLIDPLWEKKLIFVISEDEADKIFMEEAPNTLVSYTITPSNPGRNACCYKMLIDAYTHELCYYAKHKVGAFDKIGFTISDMSSISRQKNR